MPLWYDNNNPNHKEPIVCDKCNCTGKLVSIDWGFYDKDYTLCGECNGRGYLDKD